MAAKIYSSEVHSILLENMEIQYELTRKSVKNVNLRIDAAGNVKVSASRCVPVDYIEDFMRQKQMFIVAAVERAQERRHMQQKKDPQKARQYVDGEQLTLLGNKLVVKIIKSETERIDFDPKYLYFQVKAPEDIRHKELMYEKWLKVYQRGVYETICHQVHQQFQQYGVGYPEIRIRRMTSRWGSCQPYKGVVTLSSRLIETPPGCIEYVVMHEFCHFIHPDHSKAFHALMTRLMPDWKQREKMLNAISEWN